MWQLGEDGRISSVLEPSLSLAVDQDHKHVVLSKKRGDLRDLWAIENLVIRSLAGADLVLTEKHGHLIVDRLQDESPWQMWSLQSGKGRVQQQKKKLREFSLSPGRPPPPRS